VLAVRSLKGAVKATEPWGEAHLSCRLIKDRQHGALLLVGEARAAHSAACGSVLDDDGCCDGGRLDVGGVWGFDGAEQPDEVHCLLYGEEALLVGDDEGYGWHGATSATLYPAAGAANRPGVVGDGASSAHSVARTGGTATRRLRGHGGVRLLRAAHAISESEGRGAAGLRPRFATSFNVHSLRQSRPLGRPDGKLLSRLDGETGQEKSSFLLGARPLFALRDAGFLAWGQAPAPRRISNQEPLGKRRGRDSNPRSA
jgi:hypothetical protein